MNPPILDRQACIDAVQIIKRRASLELDALIPHLSPANLQEVLRAVVETCRELVEEGRASPDEAFNDRIGALERLIAELRLFAKASRVTSFPYGGTN